MRFDRLLIKKINKAAAAPEQTRFVSPQLLFWGQRNGRGSHYLRERAEAKAEPGSRAKKKGQRSHIISECANALSQNLAFISLAGVISHLRRLSTSPRSPSWLPRPLSINIAFAVNISENFLPMTSELGEANDQGGKLGRQH